LGPDGNLYVVNAFQNYSQVRDFMVSRKEAGLMGSAFFV
jgi:hypothetical protein